MSVDSNNNRKALKSGAWYLFANFAVKAMALITTPIFTRLLTKGQFGDYSNYTSWASIAVIIITMSMESSLISAKFDFEDRLNQYNYSIITLTLLSTAVWAILINCLSSFFVEFTGLRLFYLNLIVLYCFFYAVVNIYQINERFHFRYKRSVFLALSIAVSTTVLSVILVLLMEDRLTGRIIGTVLPYIIFGAFLFFHFVKNGDRVDFSTWPYVLKICIPFVPHLLSLTLLNSVDRIMITRICGASDNAMYTVAYTCGHMVTLLMTSMNNAFSPWLGEKLHGEDYQQIKNITRYYIGVFCVLALVLMLFAPEILLILGGSKYLSAKYVMTPVAMGCVCQFLYTLYVNVEQYKKKTVGMAFASASAALLNYVLNAIFIPKYGYVAAAYTTLVGYLFLLLIHMLLVKHINVGDLYDNRFVVLIVVLMIGLTLGVNVLYGRTLLRFITILIVLCALGILAFLKRKIVIRLVRTIFGKK